MLKTTGTETIGNKFNDTQEQEVLYAEGVDTHYHVVTHDTDTEAGGWAGGWGFYFW